MRITKGQLKNIIRETLREGQWGSYAQKGESEYNDTIVMSPHGDSVLVGGEETYPQDVTNKLEADSGFKMDPNTARLLSAEIQKQFSGGYVELPVRFAMG